MPPAQVGKQDRGHSCYVEVSLHAGLTLLPGQVPAPDRRRPVQQRPVVPACPWANRSPATSGDLHILQAPQRVGAILYDEDNCLYDHVGYLASMWWTGPGPAGPGDELAATAGLALRAELPRGLSDENQRLCEQVGDLENRLAAVYGEWRSTRPM